MTPEQLQAWRWEREIDERNRPLTDDELDAMFPEGYKVYLFIALESPLGKKKNTALTLCLCTGPASPSRLCAHSYSSTKAVSYTNSHWWNDRFPHASRGPHSETNERPTIRKPPLP